MYYEFCLCGISETRAQRHDINISVHLQTIQVSVMMCIFTVLVCSASLEATVYTCWFNYFVVHTVVS